MIAKTIGSCALSNGLTLIHAHVPGSSAFHLSLQVLAGSRDEPSNLNGAFHFLEHMMFRGSRRYGDSIALANALEDLGGENNATTDAEITTFWLEGHAHRLEEAFGIFSEFFFHPTFADMETERSILLQELAEDCNEEGALIDTHSLALGALFGNHPLGHPVIGTAHNIERITQSDLKLLRQRHYRPDRSVLVLSSPAEIDVVVRWAEAHFASPWPTCAQPPPPRSQAPLLLQPKNMVAKRKSHLHVVTQNNSDSQFDFRLMLPAHGGSGEAVVAQQFLERLLDDGIASRLASSIREKHGLAYDISCEIDSYTDVGTCSVAASIAAESLPQFLQALKVEMHRLVQETPSPQEMERVRSRYLFSARALPEDLSAYLDHRVWHHFLGASHTLEHEIEMVQAMTPQRLLTAAQDILGAGHRVGVLVGPEGRRHASTLERFLESLEE